jgi:hypothetical protein
MSDLLLQLLQKQKGKSGHILYHFDDNETYLQNAVTFITAGVKEGSHIMMIENDRNRMLITRKLQSVLSDQELAQVHFDNNYDFYYSNKTFGPERIFSHFKSTVNPYLEKNVPLWTWGLIEWGNQQEILESVAEYESQIDPYISRYGLTSVCAYERKITPDALTKLLQECHDVTLTDDGFEYHR